MLFHIYAHISQTEPTTITASVPLAITSGECPRCSRSKKSGKRSCCARGGAWFKSCGDTGDMSFDHSWAEGIQACKGFVTSVSVHSALKLTSLPAIVTDYPIHSGYSQYITQNQIHIGRFGSLPKTDSTGGDELTKTVVCACFFFIFSHFETHLSCLIKIRYRG